MRVAGFHVHFGPDVKGKRRNALFPKAPAVQMRLFLYVGSGDCLIDLAPLTFPLFFPSSLHLAGVSVCQCISLSLIRILSFGSFYLSISISRSLTYLLLVLRDVFMMETHPLQYHMIN